MCQVRLSAVLVRCERVGADSVFRGCFQSRIELAQVMRWGSGVRVRRGVSAQSRKVSRVQDVGVPVAEVSRPSSNKRVRFAEGSESWSGVQTKSVIVQGSSGGTRYVVKHKSAVHRQWSFREDGRSVRYTSRVSVRTGSTGAGQSQTSRDEK